MTEKTIRKARGFIEEFKQFAIKGNALQLAVAVVVGNAFTGIVNSLVSGILTPLFGLFTSNGRDLSNLSLTLRGARTIGEMDLPPLLLRYGAFFQSVINFLIIALSMFLIIKLSSAAFRRFAEEEKRQAPPPAPPEPSAETRVLEEIRDILKKREQ